MTGLPFLVPKLDAMCKSPVFAPEGGAAGSMLAISSDLMRFDQRYANWIPASAIRDASEEMASGHPSSRVFQFSAPVIRYPWKCIGRWPVLSPIGCVLLRPSSFALLRRASDIGLPDRPSDNHARGWCSRSSPYSRANRVSLRFREFAGARVRTTRLRGGAADPACAAFSHISRSATRRTADIERHPIQSVSREEGGGSTDTSTCSSI